MTNDEIDIRLKALALVIPKKAAMLTVDGVPGFERELELLNMNAMAIWSMLGEIAKRLPEPQPKGDPT